MIIKKAGDVPGQSLSRCRRWQVWQGPLLDYARQAHTVLVTPAHFNGARVVAVRSVGRMADGAPLEENSGRQRWAWRTQSTPH